jgi:hypothetical protein
MKAFITPQYPVFEPDQVLSQKHLNNIVGYFDEQDRIMRTGLTGIGIVSGLKISFPSATEIRISCGTAITSLGYQIAWKEKTFAFFHEAVLSQNFLRANLNDDPYFENILGNNNTFPYLGLEKALELLEAEAPDEGKSPVSKGFLDDKVVMLLLETSLINEKNCVNTNCDNKGKRFEFNIRPLLVDIQALSASDSPFLTYPRAPDFPKLELPRYNTPFKSIKTGQEVLDAFDVLLADPALDTVSNHIQIIYNYYKSVIRSDADLAGLENIKPLLSSVINANINSLRVQYLWHWLYDIMHAYNEIAGIPGLHPVLSCIDSSLFPFHVILGNAADGDLYRTPFYKTGHVNKEKNKIRKLSLLFERLALIVKSWSIQDGAVKITPSRCGDIPLSKKSIPYYYGDVPALKNTWNARKALKNRSDGVLSYHFGGRLPFDLEPYNFFRIEGHIGRDYQDVLTEISAIKSLYNLPFKVIALNAVDYVGKDVDISRYDGDWGDLELQYDIARRKFYNIIEDVVKWIGSNKAAIMAKFAVLTEGVLALLNNILTETKALFTESLSDFLPGYDEIYEILKNLYDLFLTHRLCISFLNRDDLPPILEDLVDHMDEVHNLFLEDPFTIIYEAAQKRWENQYRELFLSVFQLKHSGLEPGAGVTKGGTFAIVYSDTSIFTPKARAVRAAFLLENIKRYTQTISTADNIKREVADRNTYRKMVFTPPKPTDEKVLTDCTAETEKIKAELMKLADTNLKAQFPAHLREFFKGNLAGLFQLEAAEAGAPGVPQKVVLADFFLPYICCSEGNNINIVLESKALEPGDFDHNDFNNEDFNTNK